MASKTMAVCEEIRTIQMFRHQPLLITRCITHYTLYPSCLMLSIDFWHMTLPVCHGRFSEMSSFRSLQHSQCGGRCGVETLQCRPHASAFLEVSRMLRIFNPCGRWIDGDFSSSKKKTIPPFNKVINIGETPGLKMKTPILMPFC